MPTRLPASPSKLRVPSLDALYVFAVAARHLSFTAAADELHRTQSAVSHRIKALEAEIGMPLFQRGPRDLQLTAAGRAIARQVEQSISDVARSVATARVASSRRPLRLTMLPSVASRWLMPRLAGFQRQHPEISLQVIADVRVLDLNAEGIDLAIRFGAGRYRGLRSLLLMEDYVLPVCSPALLDGRRALGSPEAMLELPLLHDVGAEGDVSLSDWRAWLDQIGRPDLPSEQGERFNHVGLAIEAAVHGLGIAMARISLVADLLVSGVLLSPLPILTPTTYSYYIVTPQEREMSAAAALFVDWLQQQAREVQGLVAQFLAHERTPRRLRTVR